VTQQEMPLRSIGLLSPVLHLFDFASESFFLSRVFRSGEAKPRVVNRLKVRTKMLSRGPLCRTFSLLVNWVKYARILR